MVMKVSNGGRDDVSSDNKDATNKADLKPKTQPIRRTWNKDATNMADFKQETIGTTDKADLIKDAA